MGFTLKNKDFKIQNGGWPIMEGLYMLAQQSLDPKLYSVKEAYNIKKIMKGINKLAEETAPMTKELLTALSKKYGAVNENGELIYAKDEKGVEDKSQYLIKEDCKEAYRKELMEYDNLETSTIEANKLKLSELEKYALNPMALLYLEPIIDDDLAAVEEAQNPTLPFPEKK